MDELKVNRKSLRLSDKVCQYIDGYRGDSFNDKFENLVLDFMERRDDLVTDWNKLQAAVADKRVELRQAQDKLWAVRNVDARLKPLVDALMQLLPDG